MAQIEGAGARQRFLPDHAPRLQPRAGRIHRLVSRRSRGPPDSRRRPSPPGAWRSKPASSGPISINVRITAVRKLAVEAADNGLLAPELASGIARIKGVRSHGVRVGNWLSLRQAQALLNAPDVRTKKGLRDRAMFATLLGCGLRRSELANLTMKHVQQRDSRWCIVDLVGKHGRVRTIPMPAWVKNAIDAWTAEAGVTEGHLFRPVNRGDQVCGERMSEKVVWQMLKTYVVGGGPAGHRAA